MRERLSAYLKENWGAPFVLGFIILIMVSAAFLAVGDGNAANGIAVYAYCALVLGVLLQIASYVKYERKGSSPSTG